MPISVKNLIRNNHVPKDTRVALLYGGKSSEREISIMSGNAAAEALTLMGYHVKRIDTKDSNYIFKLKENNPDIVFMCLHGKGGEDGCVQGVCEELGLAYTGSGVLASSLTMDKIRSKELYLYHGIATPQYEKILKNDSVDVEDIIKKLGSKVVIKPVCEGSTIGMSFANGKKEIEAGIKLAQNFDSTILVEQFVEGTEVTVVVLGNLEPVALSVLEIVALNGVYDYEHKYQEGKSTHYCPARINDELRKKCQEISISAHKILGCAGISRSDIIIDSENKCWMLETNTTPGLTSTSLVPDAARTDGLEFSALCSLYIDLAFDRENLQK